MSKSIKLAAIVIGLLVIIAVTHSVTDSTLDDIAPAKKKNDFPKPEEPHKEKGMVKLPEPMGAPDAKVHIKVFVTSDNTCDTSTLQCVQNLHKKFGDKIYVTFGDMLDAETKEEAQAAQIGCKSGITINGKSKFVLPERGLKGAILLDGPTGEKNYDPQDLEDVVVHLLKQKGVLKDEGAQAGQAGGEEEKTGEDVGAKEASATEAESPAPDSGD